MREGVEKPVGLGDHEVNLEHGARALGERPERRDDERTHAQVGDEVSVHDVDVDAAHPRLERVGHLGAEPEEVGGENRR